MKLIVNASPQEIPEKSTLQNLMQQLHVELQRGIAVAVNDKVVPRAKWNEFALQENDKVLMIQPSQGG
jgi:sulfur carrier protein